MENLSIPAIGALTAKIPKRLYRPTLQRPSDVSHWTNQLESSQQGNLDNESMEKIFSSED